MKNDIFKRAPHNPPHLFLPDTYYILTASIYQQEPLLLSPQRKMEWLESFFHAAKTYHWLVIAWVILNNHYHAILRSPEKAGTLSKLVASYHKYTARKWNLEDELTGRKVWWNYWDTCLLTEDDFYNRLRYVFWNPVKHGLIDTPDEYKFSNYKEFLLNWQVDFDFTDTVEVNDVPEF
jgi:putative transposase